MTMLKLIIVLLSSLASADQTNTTANTWLLKGKDSGAATADKKNDPYVPPDFLRGQVQMSGAVTFSGKDSIGGNALHFDSSARTKGFAKEGGWSFEARAAQIVTFLAMAESNLNPGCVLVNEPSGADLLEKVLQGAASADIDLQKYTTEEILEARLTESQQACLSVLQYIQFQRSALQQPQQ